MINSQAWSRFALTALAMVGLFAGARRAEAQLLTWDPAATATNNWSTTAGDENWLPGPVVWTNGSDAVFGTTAETVNVTTANTVDDITFNITGYVISNGAGGLTLADANSDITVNGLATDIGTINETIAGAGSITKLGAGILSLGNANTYTGGTIVSAGTLRATVNTSGNALGTGAASVAASSLLQLNNTNTTGTTVTIANTFTGAGELRLNFAAGTTARNTVMNNVTGVTGTIRLSNSGVNADKWSVSGIGTVAGNLIIENNSQLYIAGGTNTFTGGINVIGTGNSETRGAIRLAGTLGGTVTLAGNTTIGSEGGTISGAIMSGAVGTQTLTVGTASSTGNATFSGVVGGGTGTIALTKTQAGTLILTNTNTYTGATTVSAGTLQLGSGGTTGSLSPSSALSFTGGTGLNINRSNTVTQGVDFSGAVFSGHNVILTKSGPGNVVLAGANQIRQLNINNATGALDIGATSLSIGNGGGTTITSSTGGTINATGGGTLLISTGGGTNYGDNSTAAGTTLTINAQVTGPVANGFEFWSGSAGGTIFLANNANNFAGDVFINSSGTIRTSTIGNTGVASGVGMGNVINLNAANANLDYVGTGTVTTNRGINIGNAFSTFITQSGASGSLTFNGNFTGGSGTKTLTLQGSTAGTGQITSNIGNGSAGTQAITKSGSGTWTLSGNNTFSGATTVNAGRLVLTKTAAAGATSGAFVHRGATMELSGAVAGDWASAVVAPVSINGSGIGGTGALLSSNVSKQVNSTVTTVGNSTIGNSTAGTALTLNGPVSLGTFANLTFAGAGDIIVNSGFGNGAAAVNGIRETIFDSEFSNPQSDINPYIVNSNALGVNDAQGNLTGHLNYANDAAFNSRADALLVSGFDPDNGPTGGNDYSALWVTRFTPDETGVWHFMNTGSDDNQSFWLDNDQNGIFEQTGVSDRIHSRTCCGGSGDISTVSLTAGQTYLLGFVMNDTGGGGSFVDMNFARPSAPATWIDLNPGANPGLFTVIPQSDVLKTGLGTTVLAGNNTYNGTTTISQGTLQLGNGGTTGSLAASSTVTLGDASTGANNVAFLVNRSDSNTHANNIVVSALGTGTVTIGSTGTAAGSLPTVFSGTVTLNRATTMQGTDPDRTTWQGVISGNVGTLTVRGGARTTWEANNTFVGNVVVMDSGTVLQIGAAGNQIPDASNVDLAAGTTLRLNNDGEAINALTGSGTVANIVGGNTLTVGANHGGGVFSGVLQNGSGTLTLVKSGSGTQTLSGANTYTGATTISGGVLQIGNGGAAGTLGTGSVTNNASLVFNRTDTHTVANIISGTGSVTNKNTGTTVLNGGNSYTGGTTISQGAIHVGNATALGAGAATLNDGATGANNTSLLATGAFTVANNITIANAGSGTSTIGTTTFASATETNFTGSVTLNKATTFQGGNSDRTTYEGIISGSGAITIAGGRTTFENNANSFTGDISIGAGSVLQVGLSTTTNVVPDTINVDVGAGGGFWLNTYSESINGLSGSGTVQVNAAPIIPTSSTVTLTVGANNGSATFDGVITDGTGLNARTLALTKTGSGTQTLAGNNTYTGDTAISGGTLQIGNGGSSGTLGTGSVTNNAALVFNRTDTHTVGNTIGGTGSLTISNTGTTVLTANNTYTGATNVNQGTLTLNGSIEFSSLTTVASGATLNGTGTTGALTIDAGGFHNPGNSPGTTTVVGNYIENGTLITEFLNHTGGAGVGYDQVVVQGGGNVTIGGTATLSTPFLGGAGTFSPTFGQVFTIIDNQGAATTTTGAFVGLPAGSTIMIDGDPLKIYYDNGTNGNDVVLVASGGTASQLYVNDDWIAAGTVDGDQETAAVETAYVGVNAFATTAAAFTAQPSYSGALRLNGGTYASVDLTAAGTGAPVNVTLELAGDLNTPGAPVSDVTIQNLQGNAGDQIVTRFNGGTSGNLIVEQGTFGGNITGTGSLTKTTAGTLSLGGASSYAGGTTLSQGTLRTTSATGLGTGAVTLGDAATGANNIQLRLAANGIANSITVSNNGTGTATIFGETQYHSHTGTISLNRATIFEIPNTGTGDWWYAFGGGGISGAGPVTIKGGGGGVSAGGGGNRIVFGGNNSYSGGTTIESGQLQLNSLTGAGSGSITLGNASSGTAVTQLRVGANIANSIIVSSAAPSSPAGIGTYNSLQVLSGSLQINRPLTINGGSDRLTWSGPGAVWSGSGDVTISGGRVTHDGTANTWTGNMTINASSTFQPGHAATLTSANSVTVNGTLQLNNVSQTINGLSGSGTVRNIIGANTLTVGAGNASTAFSGTMQDNSGALSLIKAGTGTLTLTGASTYTGGTVLSQGTLVHANNLATGSATTGAITLGNAGTGASNLDLQFTTGVQNSNTATAYKPITVTSNGTGTATLTFNQGTAFVNAALNINKAVTLRTTGGSAQFGLMGQITGAGAGAGNDSVIFSAPGGTTLYYTAGYSGSGVLANSFQGNVRFTGGGLINTQNLTYINAAYVNGAIPDTASVTVDAGTTWGLQWGAETINALNGGGAVSNNGFTLNVGANGGSGTYSGGMSGAGALVKSGSGTQTLNGAGSATTYSGGTTVNGGILQLGGANNSFSTVGNGTLTINAGAQVVATAHNVFGHSADANIPKIIINGGTLTPFQYLHVREIEMTGGTITAGGTAPFDGLDFGHSPNTLTTFAGAGTATVDAKITNRTNTTFTVANDAAAIDLALNGAVVGTGGITKNGAGRMAMSGLGKLYTGTTNHNAGILEIRDVGSGSGDGFRSNIVNNSEVWLTATTGQISDHRANISGTGSLVKKDAGRVRIGTFSGLPALTYSGTTTVEAGILDLQGQAAGRGFDTSGGLIISGGAEFQLTGLAAQSSANAARFGALSGAGTVRGLFGTPWLEIGNGGGSGTFTGLITNNAGVPLSLIKSGTGTQTLTGNNTYTGATNVSAGTLIVDGTTTGQGLYTVASGARLGGDGVIGANVNVVGTPGAISPGGANLPYTPPATPGGYSGHSFDATYTAGEDLTAGPNGTVGLLTVNGNVDLEGYLLIDLISPTLHDLLDVNGLLAIDGSTSSTTNHILEINGKTDFTQIDFGALGLADRALVTLVTADSISGSFYNTQSILNRQFTDAGGNPIFFGQTGTSIFLQAVPEPASITLWVILGLSAVAGAWRLRRRAMTI